MKRIFKLALLLWVFTMLSLALSACSSAPKDNTQKTDPVAKGEYHKISAEDAHKIINGNDAFILLDVRTQEEFDEKHIEGAVLIPDFQIAEKASTLLPDKEATILVYCRSGNRSATASNKLAEMGYTKVYDFGGIKDWKYDTVKGK